MDQYIINYTTEETLEELVKQIDALEGLPLSKMKIQDLVFNSLDGEPIRTGNGVYIFKNSEMTFYIGNCFARNFVERIPAHFDIRHNGWFNSLLKAIIKNQNIDFKNKTPEEKNEFLEKAAKIAFDKINIVLVNFLKYDKTEINNLERRLAEELNPINTRFRKIKVDINEAN